MVFRILFQGKFASTATRTAAKSTITSAISGRDMTVLQNTDTPLANAPTGFVWEATSGSTGDMGIVYALLQGMTTPAAGSLVRHHTCFHGDNTALCLLTAEKVW